MTLLELRTHTHFPENYSPTRTGGTCLPDNNPPPPPTRRRRMFLLLLLLQSAVAAVAASAAAAPSSCQRITIPMCVGIGYNHTQMPNTFNHDTQDEAGLEVHQYWPLVVINCSSDLRFFLCSVYTPICMADYKGSVPACRSVCQRARHGCEPVMTQYGFLWPERMSCDKFPPYGVKNTVCMDEKKGLLPPVTTNVVVVPPVTPPLPPNKKKSGCNKKCTCPHPFLITSSNETDSPCKLTCHFGTTQEEQTFANNWIAAWATLCLAISTFTISTFCANKGERFKYPERPVVYMSLCYGFVSCGYLLRIYFGHQAVACNNNLIKYGTDNSNQLCIAVFILIYFFTMAAAVWWVTLSLTWYLAAGCKWGSEAIASHAKKYHLVAWTAPAIGTTAAIYFNKIDGDPIAGICLVGNQSPSTLLEYVVVPLGVLLLLGTSFLLAGFIALVRIRRVLRGQSGGHSKTEKLEKLMLRIGVFGVLYALPAASVIAAYLYEIHAKTSFLKAITNCNDNCTTTTTITQQRAHKPSYPVLMIKYFMSLAVGTTSGLVWIWSGKTLETWRTLICCTTKQDSKKMAAAQAVEASPGKLISHV